MYNPKYGCTTSAHYTLKVGKDKLKINDSSCSNFSEYELLKTLGFTLE